MRLVLVLLHALAWTCAAVSVGDRDSNVRELLNGSDANCSNATTLALLNATSTASSSTTDTRAQIVTGGSCETTVVSATQVPSKTAADTPVLELDVRKRGIERVAGIPSSIQVLQLDDNAVETLQPGQGGGNATTYISLVNNRITSLATFTFPPSLLTLDLTANALESIDTAVFPPKLSTLNITRNPITSLEFARLPSKLQHLNVAGARLQTLEHLSLPNSLLSLNVSGNPITRIAGVRFPASLQRLVISSKAQIAFASSTTSSKTTAAAIAAATSANEITTAGALGEFEVRRTDAERFRKLQLFHVAATSTRSCSDARAKFFVINDTVLCVLSDDDFATKYAHVTAASVSSDDDGDDTTSLFTRMNATRTNRMRERLRLHETWHQRRSWFLLVSASLLGGVAVAIGISGCCQTCARRASARYRRRRRDVAAMRSMHKAPVSATKSALEMETETEVLLSGSNGKSERPAGARSTTSSSNKDELQPLRRSMLSSPPRRLATSTSVGSTLANQDDESVQVTYALASLRDQVVMLKTLHVQRKRQRPDVEATDSRVCRRSAALRRFMAEIRLHATLSHPHLVRFVGYLDDPFDGLSPKRLRFDTDGSAETLTLVTEFMPNGTLDDVVAIQRAHALDALASQRSGAQYFATQQQQRSDHDAASPREVSLDTPEVIHDAWSWHYDSPTLPSKLSVAIAIARVLAYLHAFESSLFHGNLSARKVLLDESWRAQLSDLSCSSALQRWSERQLSRTQSASPSPRGSVQDRGVTDSSDDHDSVQMDMTVWTAPEVIDGQQYTTKADMYSFGILLAYLDTYEFPVDLLHRVDSDVAILSTSDGNPKMIPMMGSARAPAPIRMLVLQCLSFQPEDRPSAQEALDELLALQLDLQDIASSSEVVD